MVLNCAKPDYLKAGDKVAMISPSYYTPMETIEKAANVLRSWGFEPVIAPNVDKVLDGKIGGTVEERVSDIRWALDDPSVPHSCALRISHRSWRHQPALGDGCPRHHRRAHGRSHPTVRHRRRSADGQYRHHHRHTDTSSCSHENGG